VIRAFASAAAACLLLAAAPEASAHAMPTSAVLLDIDAHAVRGEVRLPLDRLAVALVWRDT
jgi:hypothetical protein